MNTEQYILDKFKITSNEKFVSLPIGRYGLCELFAELNFNTGAEIGVDRGQFSESLLRANKNLKLFSIDCWSGEYADCKEEACKRLEKYNCEIINDTSLNAVNRFDDGSLDFVYIDGSHTYEDVLADIIKWSPKIKTGGIISGHDYIRGRYIHKRKPVRVAIEDYLTIKRDINRFFMANKNSQSNWFFIKK